MQHSSLDKKGHGSNAQLSPPRSQAWLRGGKSQLAAPSGPSFTLAQLTSLREPGMQPNWASVSQDALNGETRSHKLPSRHMVTAMQLQRQGSGGGSPLLKASGGPREGPEPLQDVPRGLSSTDPSLSELKALRGGLNLPLTSIYLITTH